MLNSETYVKEVLRTDCPITPELIERVSNETNVRLLHAAMGMVTESAELMDMLKKHIFYGKPLDMVNAKEETGDALWYVGLAVDVMRTTVNEIMTLNINKLRLRYPEKFSESDAVNRDVDAERILLEGQGWSERGKDWIAFAEKVLAHIENYTVPQYGDKGNDQATDYNAAELMRQVAKYAARNGKNARPGQEQLDAIKAAHYAQMSHDKL